MKKAIHHWGLPPEYGLYEKLRLAQKLGYDGVELGITKTGDLPLEITQPRLETVRTQAEDLGLCIHALTCTPNWEASATSDRPEIREKARMTLLRQIEIAAHLKADAVLALPGFVTMDFTVEALCSQKSECSYSPVQERIRYDIAYERAVSFFRSVAPRAGDAGVTICAENIWNHFLLSPLEMRGFIDDIGSDYVQSYFDVANVMPTGYAEQWIGILGSRIKRVHFKDYVLASNSLSGFTQLLEGDVDYGLVMEALRSIGYEGWVTAEVNAPVNDRGVTAKKAIAAMEKIIGGV